MLDRTAQFLEMLNERFGQFLALTPLALILVQFGLVLSIHVFAIGSIKAQESLQYINALMFLGGVGYTALHQEHVRVDLFYSRMKARNKDLVDLLGTLFFIVPILFLLWITATPYALASWANFEGSTETAGLQLVYLLKSTILLFTLSLTIFAVGQIIRLSVRLAGKKG